MKASFEYQKIPDSNKDSCSKLRDAVRTKDKNLVEYLLDSGTNVNGIGQHFLHCTPLHLAVSSRCPEIVELLLSKGADTSLRCEKGDTPLTWAATMGSTALIDLLLAHDVQNVENPRSNLSHFHIACMRNNLGVVKKLTLMDHGKNVNMAVNKNSLCWASYTALHFAAQYGCTETAEFLLKSGADFTAKDERHLTPLHVANLHRNEEIIDLILSAHKQIYDNPTASNGLSHFHIACSRNNESVVRHFLNLGVDVNQPTDGWRAIDFASYYECPDVIRVLLEKNIILDGTRISRLSECAFGLKGEATYDLCVKERLKFKKRYKSYMPAFHRICVKDDIEFMKRLLNMTMIINVPPVFRHPSWTQINPLHLAVRHKSVKVIKFLLDHEGDITVQDNEGKTPLHIAFEKKLPAVVNKMIEKLGSSPVNLSDHQGLSLFHIICTTYNLNMIQTFLSNGVDINARVGQDSTCWAGCTPLHFAVEFHQLEVVDILLKSGADISVTNVLGLNPFDLLTKDLYEHSRYLTETCLNTISEILLVILSSLSSSGKKIDSKGMSVLHAPCIGFRDDGADLYDYLITHRNEVNQALDWPQSRHYHNCTPLHLAMQNQNFCHSELLINRGADLLALNGEAQTSIELAAKFGYSTWEEAENENDLAIFKDKSSIELWSKPSHFHFACVIGLLNNVRDVLNSVTDENLKLSCLNCRNDAGQTPLHTLLLEASEETPGKLEIIRLLLEKSAEVDSKDCELQTPLHCAQNACSPVYSQILISNGANINAQNLYGQTPMHCCLFKSIKDSVVEKITLLLENGADVNIVDERGQTCLMMKKDSFENQDDFRNAATVMLKHVKKLQVIGSFISNENKFAYTHLLEDSDRPFNEAAFVDECLEELVEMTFLDIDHHTTLSNLLFKSLNALTAYCKNIILQNTIESDDFLQKYPIYGSIIKFRMKKAKVRRSLLKKAVSPLNFLLKNALPQLCLPVILGHLHNAEDLENICLSAQIPEQND